MKTWLHKHCFFYPESQSDCITCMKRLGMDVVPYHPDYAKTYFRNGAEEFVSLSGVPNKSTLLCHEGGPWQSFQADLYGYSNSSFIWENQQLDTVLLGDSFTIGECVAPSERFATLLQQTHPRTLNLGYPNSGPLSELARYLEYGHMKKPKHIFIFYYELNDAQELLDEYANPILSRYLDEKNYTQNLMGKSQVIQEQLEPWLIRNISHHSRSQILDLNETKSALKTFWHKIFYPTLTASNRRKPERPKPDPVVPLFQRVFLRFRDLAIESGSKVHVVYLPSKLGDFGFYKDDLQQTVERLGIDFIDMTQAFAEAQWEPYSGFEPYHYNAKAHQVITQKILTAY